MTWQRVPLRELGQWYGGGTPSKANAAFWRHGSIPWLSPKDMGPNTLVDTQDHITGTAVSGSAVKVIPRGSVAVVVRSGILERTLPIALVPFETTLNQDMKAVVPRDGVDTRWIAWGLRAFERELLRTTRKAGTTVASIEMPRFHSFELPVPPLDEQRRIVEILDDHLSRLDAAERGLELAGSRLRALRLATLHREVTGDFRRLGDMAIDSRYGTSIKCTQYGAGVAVAGIPNIVGGTIDMADEKRANDPTIDLSGLLLRKGDLLIVRTNGSRNLIGRSAVVHADMDVAFASYLIRYRLDAHQVLPEWVQLAFETPRLRTTLEGLAASSAGQYNLGLKKLDGVNIPCPGIRAQRDSVARIREMEADRLRLAASVAKQHSHSTNLRRALLGAAFSGKLTGRHTDDEVVEELARAQRGAEVSGGCHTDDRD